MRSASCHADGDARQSFVIYLLERALLFLHTSTAISDYLFITTLVLNFFVDDPIFGMIHTTLREIRRNIIEYHQIHL